MKYKNLMGGTINVDGTPRKPGEIFESPHISKQELKCLLKHKYIEAIKK